MSSQNWWEALLIPICDCNDFSGWESGFGDADLLPWSLCVLCKVYKSKLNQFDRTFGDSSWASYLKSVVVLCC